MAMDCATIGHPTHLRPPEPKESEREEWSICMASEYQYMSYKQSGHTAGKKHHRSSSNFQLEINVLQEARKLENSPTI